MTRYLPIIDLVDDEGEWTVESTTHVHAKQTKPRAGGGSLSVPTDDSEASRIERKRALIDVKWGVKSKTGNVGVPLVLLDAAERARLDLLGVRLDIFDRTSPSEMDLVFGPVKYTVNRAVALAVEPDNRFNLVTFAANILPAVVRAQYAMTDDDRDDRIVEMMSMAFVAHYPMGVSQLAYVNEQFLPTIYNIVSRPVRTMVGMPLPSAADEKAAVDLATRIYRSVGDTGSEKKRAKDAEKSGAESLTEAFPAPKGETELDEARRVAKERMKEAKKKRGEASDPSARAEEAEPAGAGKPEGFQFKSLSEATSDAPPKATWLDDTGAEPSAWDKNVEMSTRDRRHSFYGETRNVIWGTMAVLQMPLTKNQPAKIRGRVNRPSELGRVLRHPHRVVTDKRVFSAKRAGIEGTFLIDVSGSMGFGTEDIDRLVEAIPAATIAVYSGPWTPMVEPERWAHLSMEDREIRLGGALRIVAAKGRRYEGSYKKMPPHLGGGSVSGGNIVDGPALFWLSRQKGPRIWVCDGAVTGVYINAGGHYYDHGANHLAKETVDFQKKHKILRLDNMPDALSFVADNPRMFRGR